MYAAPFFDVHGVTIPPMPKPVVVPLTEITPLERAPVIVMEARTGAAGVTASDGADHGPHPAPLSARTSKVYAVPFVRPLTSHDSTDVTHMRPDGDAVT